MPIDTHQRASILKNQQITESSAVYWIGKKNRLKTLKRILKMKIVASINLLQTTTQTIITTTTTKRAAELKESQKNCLSTLRDMWEDKPLHSEMLLWSQCIQLTTSPAQITRKSESGPRKSQPKWCERNCSGCSPKYQVKVSCIHSGADTDSPETIKLPPILDVVWQQPEETHLIDILKNSITNFDNSTHMPAIKQRNDAK